MYMHLQTCVYIYVHVGLYSTLGFREPPLGARCPGAGLEAPAWRANRFSCDVSQTYRVGHFGLLKWGSSKGSFKRDIDGDAEMLR